MKLKKPESELLFIPNFGSCKNIEIKNIFNKLSKTDDFSVQRECIKLITTFLGPSGASVDKEYVLELLIYLYLSKHPIKKTVSRILSQYDEDEFFIRKIHDCIKIHFQTIDTKGMTENGILMRDNFINILCNSLDLKSSLHAILSDIDLTFNSTFPFLIEIVENLWSRTSKLAFLTIQQQYSFLHNVSKFLLCLLQKCDIQDIELQNRLKLIACCYDIIIHRDITYDTKSNYGHIMIILFTKLPEDYTNTCGFKEHPYLEFLLFEQKQPLIFEKLGIQPIKDITVLKTFKVCIYLGILHVVSHDILWRHSINNASTFFYMFKELVNYAKQMDDSKNSIHILGLTYAISILSQHLHQLPFEEINYLFIDSLEFLIIYLDDKKDMIKYHAKNVYKNLIHVAMKTHREGNSVLLNKILEWLKNICDCDISYTGIDVLCCEIGCNVLLEYYPNLSTKLLNSINDSPKPIIVCSCYEALMTMHVNEVSSQDDWIKYWVNEVVILLQKVESTFSQYFQRLFLAAFKIRPIALKAITQQPYLNTDAELGAFLACIHHARKSGLYLSNEFSNYYGSQIDINNFWYKLLDRKSMEVLMTHQNDDIRIQLLAVIAETPRTTEMFDEWEITYLFNYFYYNINTTDARTKQNLIFLAKKIFTRVNNTFPKAYTENLVHLYTNFWEKLFANILLPGLNPDCNYLRKSTCLELLVFLKTLLCEKDFRSFWQSTDINNLMYILEHDTYEQNQDLTFKLISLFDADSLGFGTKDAIVKHVENCFSLALSIKPVQTVSAAYMLCASLQAPYLSDVTLDKLKKYIDLNNLSNEATYLIMVRLIFELKNCYNTGKVNLYEAAASKPIHGLVFCIRHILKYENLSKRIGNPHWKKLMQDLIDICLLLSKLIDVIISNPSPEGYLPEDIKFNKVQIDNTAKAQMITVYGWRASKEISLLFGEIALNAPLSDDKLSNGLVDINQIQTIGSYFFDLLLNTKHRGAFEQASYGFSNLCLKLWKLPTNLNKLPKQWLESIINAVLSTNGEDLKACATRRSAGLPFMVQEILSTEPKHNGNKCFSFCMDTLLRNGANIFNPKECRIHCMNILRNLYRHNQLRELALPFCAQGLMIAIEGFGSDIWNIRNSATLLFCPLIFRIFGVQPINDSDIDMFNNKMIAQVFFARYPELYDFLLEELKRGTEEIHRLTIFPVLIILSQLYPGPKYSETLFKLDVYLPYVKICLANPTYRIRNLAAIILANLITKDEFYKFLESLLANLTNTKISNTLCHGLLLQLQYLLLYRGDLLPTLKVEKIINDTSWIILCCGEQISYLTGIEYLEMLFCLIKRFDTEFNNQKILKMILNILQSKVKSDSKKNVVSSVLKQYRVYLFNLKLCLIIYILKCHYFKNLKKVCTCIIKEDLRIYPELQNACLSYVNYLKFNEEPYKNCQLYEEIDSDNSEFTKSLLKSLDSKLKSSLYEVLYSTIQHTVIADVISNSDTAILKLHKFPNLLKDMKKCDIKRWILEFNKMCCKKSDESLICISLACIDNVLITLQDEEILQLNFNKFINTLYKLSSSFSDTTVRLNVAKLLMHNKKLFYANDKFLSKNNLSLVWQTVFILLEDDDKDIRNIICQLCQQDISNEKYPYRFVPRTRFNIPEYARKDLLKQMVIAVSTPHCIDILLFLILRTKEIANSNLSEVFDEGFSNTYAEFYPMAIDAIEVLKNVLPESQISILNDRFQQNVIPLISISMKTTASNIFRQLIRIWKQELHNQEQFKYKLKLYFDEEFCDDVNLLNISEIIRLKMLMSSLFIE